MGLANETVTDSKMDSKTSTCCGIPDSISNEFQIIQLEDSKKSPPEHTPSHAAAGTFNFTSDLLTFLRKVYGLPVRPEESTQRRNFRNCLVVPEPTLKALSENIGDLLDYGCHTQVLELLSELDLASSELEHKLLTAKTRHHLGDLQTAKSLYLQVYSETVPGDVQMFGAVLGLASVAFASCQYIEAMRECQDVLSKQTLDFKARLLFTGCLIKLSNFEEAEEQLQSLQESVQADSRQWAQVQNLSAVCLLCQGEYAEALTKFNEVHQCLLGLVGHDHLETIGAAINASTAQRHLGQRVQAMQVLNQARIVLKQRFDPGHEAVLQSGICKLELLVELGKLEKASKLIEKLQVQNISSPAMKLALQLQKTELQERSWYATKAKVVEDHEQVFAKCQSAYLQVLNDIKDALGHQNRLTLRALHNLLVFWTKRSLAAHQTLGFFEKLLQVQLEVLGEKHPDVVLTEKNIEKCHKMIKLLEGKANHFKCSDEGLVQIFDTEILRR